jgi:hypothetical protein
MNLSVGAPASKPAFGNRRPEKPVWKPALRPRSSRAQGAIHVRGILTPAPALREREKSALRRGWDLSVEEGAALRGPFPLPEGQGENAPTVVALGTLEPERAGAPELPPRTGTRRHASISIRAHPAPPSPLNGERAGVRGGSTETRRSIHGSPVPNRSNRIGCQTKFFRFIWFRFFVSFVGFCEVSNESAGRLLQKVTKETKRLP